jgi:hypothetical protein
MSGNGNADDRLQIILANTETGSGSQVWQQGTECSPALASRTRFRVGGKQSAKVLAQTTSYGVL